MGETIEDYQTFVREFPQGKYVGHAFFRLGIAALKLGDVVSGTGFLQQYLNSSAEKERAEDAYYRVGSQLFSMGDIGKATQYYQQYLEKFSLWAVQAGS